MLSAPPAKRQPLLRRTSTGREQLLEVGAVVSGAELNNGTCEDGRTKISNCSWFEGEAYRSSSRWGIADEKSRKIDVESKENNMLASGKKTNKQTTNRKKKQQGRNHSKHPFEPPHIGDTADQYWLDFNLNSISPQKKIPKWK